MVGQLIDSTEMYLRTVLELEEEHIPAIRARIAERLDLSAPSVSEGVARLEDEGLLEVNRDRTVALTARGRELAEHVLRKHRLAERLLVDVLGVEPEHVHEEACRWEHVISDRVEQKLVEFLGNPTTSPYGNPMPGAEVDEDEVRPLADCDDGEVVVARISEQLQGDRETMRHLVTHGVLAGQRISVRHEDDGVALVSEGVEIHLDREDARLIYVAAI